MNSSRELQQQIDDSMTRYTTLCENGNIAGANAEVIKVNGLKTRLTQLQSNEAQATAIEAATGSMFEPGARGSSRGKSLGQQFVSDPAVQEFIKRGGHRSSSAWASPSVEISATTLTEGAGSGAGLVQPHVLTEIVPLATRRLTIANLFAHAQTHSNQIAFMKETTFTNAAAAVAETGTKPESTLVFTRATSPTEKIATWMPVTSEILEDYPLVASYVDGRLTYALKYVVDNDLLNGNGTSPYLSGILDRIGLATPIARVAQTNADAIAEQIAAIETATSLPVDGIVLNPANWLAIQLAKTSTGEYMSGSGPIGPAAQPMLWGRHVAVSPVVPVGTAVVGCFQTAAILFEHGGIKVTSTNSHADFFITNKVAILAEVRLNLVVTREAAFGVVTNLTA